MTLILLRHGDRSPGFSDVPLSQKGHVQAQTLARHPDLKNIRRILCSPKLRAQQTVQPLSQELGLTIETSFELDQMKQIESSPDFATRVQRFLESLPKNEDTTVLICSHSDWLQTAVSHLGEAEKFMAHAFFSCAEYKKFKYAGGAWTVLP